MNQRQRKAVGTVITVVVLVVWVVLGMWIYDALLEGASSWVHLIFFVLFGLAWVFPAMAVIRWMARPD